MLTIRLRDRPREQCTVPVIDSVNTAVFIVYSTGLSCVVNMCLLVVFSYMIHRYHCTFGNLRAPLTLDLIWLQKFASNSPQSTLQHYAAVQPANPHLQFIVHYMTHCTITYITQIAATNGCWMHVIGDWTLISQGGWVADLRYKENEWNGRFGEIDETITRKEYTIV